MSLEQSLSLYLYPGVSNQPRHISSSFNIYIQLRVSGLSAGKAQKTNISIFRHKQSCQYQDEVPMLSQDNLRDTQEVGEVEPKWDRRCQRAEERIRKSLWLKHTFAIELLFKKNRRRIHKYIRRSHSSNYHFQPSPVGWETASHPGRYWPGLSFSHLGHLAVLQQTDIPGHEACNT